MLNHIYCFFYMNQTYTSIELDYPKLQHLYAYQGQQLPQLFYQTAMNF